MSEHEYVLVAIRHRGTFELLSIHADFEQARTAALKGMYGFVAVPTSGDWTVLETEFGYRTVQIHKVKRALVAPPAQASGAEAGGSP